SPPPGEWRSPLGAAARTATRAAPRTRTQAWGRTALFRVRADTFSQSITDPLRPCDHFLLGGRLASLLWELESSPSPGRDRNSCLARKSPFPMASIRTLF